MLYLNVLLCKFYARPINEPITRHLGATLLLLMNQSPDIWEHIYVRPINEPITRHLEVTLRAINEPITTHLGETLRVINKPITRHLGSSLYAPYLIRRCPAFILIHKLRN